MLALYVPMGYYVDRFFYRRRLRQLQAARAAQKRAAERRRRYALAAMDVRCSRSARSPRTATSLRRDGADRGLIVDPGDEAERILARRRRARRRDRRDPAHPLHFDHIGAVAPVASATGAPVYCPEIEVPVLADIMAFVPWPGFGPLRATTPTRPSRAARRSSSPGCESTSCSRRATAPATSPTRSATDAALFSGDVLFQGSVGRVDLPGGDWPTLLESIRSLVEGYPEETTVYPGHMGITTLGAERATNPFLRELARCLGSRR